MFTKLFYLTLVLCGVLRADNTPPIVPCEVTEVPSYQFIGTTQFPAQAEVGDWVSVTWKFEASGGLYRPQYHKGDPVPQEQLIQDWGITGWGPIGGSGGPVNYTTKEVARRGVVANWRLGTTYYYDPCDRKRKTGSSALSNTTHQFILKPAPPNTSPEPPKTEPGPDPIPGPGPGGDPDPEHPEPVKRPDQGEAELSGEVVTSYITDPDRGQIPRESKAFQIIEKTDLSDIDSIGRNDVDITVVHRIVTIDSPEPRDLEGDLKITLLEGQATDYEIYQINPENGQRMRLTLPATIHVTEPGHNGGGIHDWHGGTEKLVFRRIGDSSLKLKFTVKPTEGISIKTATLDLLPVEVAVDADRDGEITFDQKDKTTAEKPYRFWVNNDRDIGHTVDETDWEQDDVDAPVSEWDAVQPGLEYRRDLEDLTRIWIDYSAINEILPTSNTSLELKVRIEPTVGQPMITLFQPVEEDGTRQYLQDPDTGYNQLQDDYGQELCRVTGATSVVVPRRAWENLPQDKIIHLLFEGANGGNGELFFELWDDGEKIFDFPAIHLVLTDVRKMYETWTVGDVGGYGLQWETWPQTSATKTTGQDLPEPETEEEKDYVLFIHGWNMEGWEKAAFADTMFKRMWHQGYKGRFGAFRWPTFWGFIGPDDYSTLKTYHYDGSEQRAWNSAAPLASLTSSLAGTFKDSSGTSLVRFYAHSMGNVVASEALRQMAATSNVHTYISAQAAIPAHVWDNTTPEMNYGGIQGPNTPNVYGHYWQTGVTTEPHLWESENRPSYMAAQYMPPTRFINHYNPNDWALAAGKWEINQKLKPNVNYDYHFPLFEQKKFFLHQPFPTIRKLLFPDDRYEIFSYAAESRSYATGAEGDTGGRFNKAQSVNLRTQFNFEEEHKGHSAQFRSFIQKRWSYWEKALQDMRIVLPVGN